MANILIFNIVSHLHQPGGAQHSIEEAISLLGQNHKILFIYFRLKSNLSSYSDQSVSLLYRSNQFIQRCEIDTSSIRKFICSLLACYCTIREFNPNVVWSHHFIPYLFFKPILSTIRNVCTIHGPLRSELVNSSTGLKNIKLLVYPHLQRLAVNNSTIHFQTKYVKEAVFTEAGLPHKTIVHVEPLLLNPHLYLPIPDWLKTFPVPPQLKSDSRIFLVPRRLDHRTGVLELVNLIKKLKDLPHDFTLVITGSGPLYPYLQEIVSTTPFVHLTGFLPYAELLKLISISACMIVPSLAAEGFCIPARIAYMWCLPLLSTGIGGIPIAYPISNNHIIFNLKSEASLSNAIGQIYKISKTKYLPSNSTQELSYKYNSKLYELLHLA